MFIKECITDALIKQMKIKPFHEITITELVKVAGVSRVSFYRNFKSKQDILERHLIVLIQEWGKDFEERGEMEYFSESLLNHYYKYQYFLIKILCILANS